MAREQGGDRERELWRRHLDDRDNMARTTLIEGYTNLVRKIAASIYSKGYRDHIGFEEFYQLGVVGLIESVDRFDPGKGAAFETFASYRIRGSILNGLEKYSEIRSQGAYQHRLRSERTALLVSEDEAHGDLFDQMVDLTLGLTVGFLLEDAGVFTVSNESAGDETYKTSHLEQLRDLLKNAIDFLPERESQIVRYHYLQGTPFDVIADLLGISKGRVSQLHKRALQQLRDRLGQQGGLDTFL